MRTDSVIPDQAGSVIVPRPASRRIPRAAADARAHRIDDGIWALQLPLCYEAVSSTNAYLLATAGGWILVDCGSSLSPGWDAMAYALESAGVTPRDIELLIVTHSHCDHRGLAAEVVERTGCRLAMGPGPHPVLDVLRDPSLPAAQRHAIGRREGIPAEAFKVVLDELPGDDRAWPPAEPAVVLAPGEELTTLSGLWEVVPAPGHSGDQIVLRNAKRGWLISADLALLGVPMFLEYGTRPDPVADQLASLSNVIAQRPDRLLPGHGRIVGDAAGRLRQCLTLIEVSLKAAAAALGSAPLSAWELAIEPIFRDANADVYQRSVVAILCVLEHLEGAGQARAVTGDDGVRRWLAPGA